MRTFESFKDIDEGFPILTQLVAAKLLCGLIEACLDGNGSYEPEDDGKVVLIMETDAKKAIEEVLGASTRMPCSNRATWREVSSSPAFWRTTGKE